MTTFKDNSAQILALVKQAAREAIEETAKEIVEEAKANAPVKTGELRDSYTYEITSDTSAIVGTPKDYAPEVEFGINPHPHFSPAVIKAETTFPQKLKEKLADKLR